MSAVEERAAQMMAHRACCGVEHDPQAGKFHGCCVVCGVPWPCEYVGPKPSHAERLDTLQKEFQQCVEQRDALEGELAGWKLFSAEVISFDPTNEAEILVAATEIARKFHEMKAENERLVRERDKLISMNDDYARLQQKTMANLQADPHEQDRPAGWICTHKNGTVHHYSEKDGWSFEVVATMEKK